MTRQEWKNLVPGDAVEHIHTPGRVRIVKEHCGKYIRTEDGRCILRPCCWLLARV